MMDIKPAPPGPIPGTVDVKPPPPPFNPLADLNAVRAYLANPAAVAADLGSSIRSALGLDGALGRMGQAALPPVFGSEEYEEYFGETNRPDK
jgi:hypothetical protein